MMLTLPSLMKSPIIEVIVGNGEGRTTYSAHQAVVIKSPEFAKQVENFEPGSVCIRITRNSSILTVHSLARLSIQTVTWTPWAP